MDNFKHLRRIRTIYSNIINRCYNETHHSFIRYGAIGVTVCDEWKNDFYNFYHWAINNGWADGLQLDKDIKAKQLGLNADLYSPDRCQFVTPKVNSNCTKKNHFIEYNGINKSISDWSDHFGWQDHVLWDRLFKLKWDLEKAFTTPLQNRGKKKIKEAS